MENSIDFFNHKAWDSRLNCFHSAFGIKSNLFSEKIYTVALGRLIYSFYHGKRTGMKSVAFLHIIHRKVLVGPYCKP
ncbi:MAG TPA: hypothetical protein DDX98_12405 [Bacteroidales bacterium]|nr:hypothetical protein [Bacteroidales bacterium]